MPDRTLAARPDPALHEINRERLIGIQDDGGRLAPSYRGPRRIIPHFHNPVIQ